MPQRMRIALPAFFEPSQPNDPVWDKLAEGRDIVEIAVFDDMDLLEGVKSKVVRAHIDPYGYVSTKTGTVPREIYEPVIDAWFERFRDLRGIFVDEGPPQDSENPAEKESQKILDYYEAVFDYIRRKPGPARVMLNCAGCRDVRVLDRCDYAVIVEKDFAHYNDPSWWNGASRPWWTDPPHHKRLAHVVYNVLTADDMRTVLALAQQRAATWAYAFDGDSGSYNRLPPYWTEELEAWGHSH
jgi:hypothetical protein